MSNLGFRLRKGVNYCAPSGQLGFRGVAKDLARLIPLPSETGSEKEMFLLFGTDVPVVSLPYVPEMGAGSDYVKNGRWHFYKIKNSVFIWYLVPKNESETFDYHEVFQVVWFEGEEAPRVIIDNIKDLSDKAIINASDRKEIKEILAEQQLAVIQIESLDNEKNQGIARHFLAVR